jgi:hypothetical protein
MKTLCATVRPVLLVLPIAAIASTAGAEVTGIYRWNATSVTSYASLGAWANNQASGSQAATIANMNSTYIFGDFTQSTPGYVYKTLLRADGAGINQIVRYAAPAGDALANLVSNTGGEVFNLSSLRNGMDDFFCDGVSFYKNQSGAVGTPGGYKYSSFANLVADVGGTYYSYAQGPFNFSDRFFGFEGKIYRTGNSGAGQVNYSVYNSFNDLVSGTIAQTVTFSQPYAGWEGFIAVPAPGALALVGLAGVAGGRNRRR